MSSWYRALDAGIWGDEKFRQLSPPSPSGQFLWIYLLTGEHTDGLPGLYRVGEAALAEALAWPVAELRRALAEITTLRMALVDSNARVIYLPNALRYQPPSNPNQIKSWAKAFRRIPECELKRKWLQQLQVYADKAGKGYVEALNKVYERVSDPNPNPNPIPNSNPNPNPALNYLQF